MSSIMDLKAICISPAEVKYADSTSLTRDKHPIDLEARHKEYCKRLDNLAREIETGDVSVFFYKNASLFVSKMADGLVLSRKYEPSREKWMQRHCENYS